MAVKSDVSRGLLTPGLQANLALSPLWGECQPSYIYMRAFFPRITPPPSWWLKGNLIFRSSAPTALGYDTRKWKKPKPSLCPSGGLLGERAARGQGQRAVCCFLGSSNRRKTEPTLPFAKARQASHEFSGSSWSEGSGRGGGASGVLSLTLGDAGAFPDSLWEETQEGTPAL